MTASVLSEVSIGTHRISWDVSERAVCLKLSGVYRPENAAAISRVMSQWMHENAQSSLLLLIDATEMTSVYQFDQIRVVQGFIYEPNLKYVFVATDNKLLRLAFMVMFKLSTAHLRLFDSWGALTKLVDESIDVLA
jgi:hypothetical protein